MQTLINVSVIAVLSLFIWRMSVLSEIWTGERRGPFSAFIDMIVHVRILLFINLSIFFPIILLPKKEKKSKKELIKKHTLIVLSVYVIILINALLVE